MNNSKKIKRGFFLMFISLCCVSTLSTYATGNASTLQADDSPKEIYGNAHYPIKIRISNGGAGPTGILKALAEDYLALKHHPHFSIAWYQNISPQSIDTFRDNKVDLALIYKPLEAKDMIKKGQAADAALIFYDHFIIVGPKENSAHLSSQDTAIQAFSKIAKTGESVRVKMFLSRADQSGTHLKEKLLWKIIQRAPWHDKSLWYVTSTVFPQQALLQADQSHLYTLIDWGTWLLSQSEIKNSVVYVQGGEELLNPCIALIPPSPNQQTLDFYHYLQSDRAQHIIADFGKDQHHGMAFFTPAKQGEFIFTLKE